MRIFNIALPVAAGFLGVQLLTAQDPVTSTTQDASGAAQEAGKTAQETGKKAKDKTAKTADQAAQATGMKSNDQAFLTKAAERGMAEVKLGQLAQERGSSDAVKNFGKQMVDDHTKANEQLKQVASSKGISLPDSIDSKSQAAYDRFSKLSGPEFDRAYMNYMRKDHKKSIGWYRKASEQGQDADVKSFAQSQLPAMEEHLRVAESHTAAMAGTSSTDRTRTDNTDMSAPTSPSPSYPGSTNPSNNPNNPNTQNPNTTKPNR
jgi:putative membrane protein